MAEKRKADDLPLGFAISSQENSKIVPAFVSKLYEIVDDPSINDVITWTLEGTSFVVVNPEVFQNELLPKYFKHNNFSSFVRQLNLYNFKKLGKPNFWEFKHDYFVRGHPEVLCEVKRKAVGTAPVTTEKSLKDEIAALSRDKDDVMNSVGNMQRNQKNMHQILERLQMENSALWEELASERQKNDATNNTLQKVMFFLMQMYTGNSALSGLLQDASASQDAKRPRLLLESEAQPTSATLSILPDTPTTVALSEPEQHPFPDLDDTMVNWMGDMLHREDSRIELTAAESVPVEPDLFDSLALPPVERLVSPIEPLQPVPMWNETSIGPAVPVMPPTTTSTAGSMSATDRALTVIPPSFLQPGGSTTVRTVDVPSVAADGEVGRVQTVIQQLLSAVVRICVKSGYSNILDNSGFGAWFNPAAAAQPQSSDPLAILVFPNQSQPPASLSSQPPAVTGEESEPVSSNQVIKM